MQAEGDRSPLLAQMRADFEAQAQTERAAIDELRSQVEGPIRLPPADLITERVLALKALAESPDVDWARAALRRYLKDGTITLTPEPFGDAQAYVARAEFMPLVMLSENAARPPRVTGEGVLPWVVQVQLRGGDSFDVPRGFCGDSRVPSGVTAATLPRQPFGIDLGQPRRRIWARRLLALRRGRL